MQIYNGNWQGFISADRESEGPFNIDLSQLRWADPVTIAGIAAAAHRAVAESRQVNFIPPQGTDQRRYLARMRLGTALEELGVDHGLEPVNERNQQGNLFELRKFSSEFDGEGLGGIVHDRLSDSDDVDPQVAVVLHDALIEVATNVSIHAGVEHGYAIAQTYPKGRVIKFAVADSGIGFRASLAKNTNIKPDDDSHAIELAVLRSVSGVGDENRGYGLADVVRTAVQFNGAVEIASGSASSRHERPDRSDVETSASYTRHLSTPYTGVIVQASIPWNPAR